MCEEWNAEMAKTIDWIEENKLQNKIAKEFSLPVNTTEDVFFDDDGNGYVTSDNSSKLVSEYDKESFDRWMSDLIKRNGTTKY